MTVMIGLAGFKVPSQEEQARIAAEQAAESEARVARRKELDRQEAERLKPYQARPGSELGLKHGAGDLDHPDRNTPRRVLVLAQQFADAYLDGYTPPQLEMPQFLPSVEAWARAEARVRLLSDWVDGMTLEEMTSPPERKAGATAAVKVPVELLMQAENQAAKRRKDLGLDPASWASIQKDLGIAGRAADDAVARMGQAGAAIRQRRMTVVDGKAE